ncbi:MAG: hypothetical protein OXH96_21730 [Spirochaetaceae bacterium]|nr:hypothetical protein [Spirochaetaceae bacterium]
MGELSWPVLGQAATCPSSIEVQLDDVLDGDGAPDLICGAEDGKTYAWLRSHLRWDWNPATRFAAGPITTTFGLVIAVDPAPTG